MPIHVLKGSERQLLKGAKSLGKADPAERLEVTVLLRRKGGDSAFSSKIKALHSTGAHRAPINREEFAREFGADPADIQAVKKLAATNGLKVVQESPARRTVVLAGTVEQFNHAFGVDLQRVEHDGETHRGRTGPIHLPDELKRVEGVFGLDDRRQAQPHFRVRPQGNVRWLATSNSFTPTEVASLYDFPPGNGQGESIGIIELGGGYRPADLKTYFSGLGVPLPKVSAVSVDHGKNHPTGDANGPDGEVMLDIEVAGAIAPAAQIAVYFAPNTDQGFLDAVTTAIHDTTNRPGVISIGWGDPESGWTPQSMTAFDQAFQDAAVLGVTICIASGDDGSRDGIADGKDHVNFPASSPYALACGGTSLKASSGAITSETVWNGGGGISSFFSVPPYQEGLRAALTNGRTVPITRRAVPDVAGNADENAGYDVRVDGTDTVIGGTSAAAALWAGLITRINSEPVGYINTILYQNQSAFNDITQGNNGDFAAAPGWNACAGLGSPNGTKIASVLTRYTDTKRPPGRRMIEKRELIIPHQGVAGRGGGAGGGADGGGSGSFLTPPGVEEEIQSRQILVTGHSASGKLITSFKPNKPYALRFRVAAPSGGNLARGDVDVTNVPETGLAAHWIVASANVEFLAVHSAGTIVKHGNTWLAEFDLAIPGKGDSETVTLDVRTTKVNGELMLTLLVAGEEYRTLTVKLDLGARVEEDIVCTTPGHLNLGTVHEWTTPPEHIEVNVFGQAARVSTICGPNDYGTVEWMANGATLKNPIQRVRNALEKFRVSAEVHLNNLDVADMEHRLHTDQWKPYGWSHVPAQVDTAHDQALTSLASGAELHTLASDGYSLFNTCFPSGSDLRGIIEKLQPGSRLDFVWTSRAGGDWVSHVPWALMYMQPIKSSEPVNCELFLGLRYRIGSKSWEPKAPSGALGDPAQVNFLNFLYWGTNEKDEVGVESLWQRHEFGKWARQSFVPDPSRKDPKQQVVAALETPQPAPAAVLYFYCHCSVRDGSDPVLQFGETSRTPDIVEASDIYEGRLETGPLVFANACTTVAADPRGTSELESRFFARDIRAFIGTETKVPVILASRFAWLFFQFFLRKADPSPMAAGEALAQARLFLWTQYRNPGGLFYCLVNRYNLYLASSEEVTKLQRR